MGLMHIPSMKGITKSKRIERLKAPDLLMVPLLKVFGSEPQPLVKPGDRVKKYQLIGEAGEKYSARVHSPVSGEVEKIEECKQLNGADAVTVFIRNDHREEEEERTAVSYEDGSPQELLDAIEKAGIVGLGGAQFPTRVKYDRKGKKVDMFIINAVECEPYLTADYALIQEYAREILEGIRIIDRILEADDIVIAFEKVNSELTDVFEPLLQDEIYRKIRIRIVPDEYPQGGELQLIHTLTGKELPKGTVTLDKGLIVSNVGTIYAVYEAISRNKPLVERVITISGPQVQRPGNYRMKIGTPVSHIQQCCEIPLYDSILISGGPMMSPHIRSFSVPFHKGTLGMVALPKRHVERLHCIWCGYCVDVCPMKLMPMKYYELYRKAKYLKLESYDIGDCIECGSCEYICPSNVPLIESILEGKNQLKKIKDAAR